MSNKNPVHKFKKGQSGNPNGRPRKENCLTDLLRQTIDKKKFVNALLKNAYAGDITAQKYVMDRLDGKILDELSINNGEFSFRVTIDDWKK